jgi:hypothetical protein
MRLRAVRVGGGGIALVVVLGSRAVRLGGGLVLRGGFGVCLLGHAGVP